MKTNTPSPAWLDLIREKVESLRFGVVQLTVHDGRVVQIERTEKTRLAPGRAEEPVATHISSPRQEFHAEPLTGGHQHPTKPKLSLTEPTEAVSQYIQPK